MGLRTPAIFEQSGEVRKAPRDKAKIQAWLQDAVGKLEDARRVENTISTRLSAAYDALFSVALAVINAQGYRVDSRDGHHAVALEILAGVLGYGEVAHEELQLVRESRNQRYDGRPPSAQQMMEAGDWAQKVLEDTAMWFQHHYPQLIKA